MAGARRVALVTLGCARNEVDSEELAARLDAGGWRVVADPARADAVVVNTCAFVASAKKDSVDAVLEARELAERSAGRVVVAVGCLAERYGVHLAQALPEADAVLGFEHYPQIAATLDAVLDQRPPPAHTPRDRRLPPVGLRGVEDADGVAATDTAGAGDRAEGTKRAGAGDRVGAGERGEAGDGAGGVWLGPASGPRPWRRRLRGGPVAPLRLASGCDRRCAFCAIPSFRGRFVSRPPEDLLAEARWLAGTGVRELVCVSENSTSYGKDFGDLRALERLLPELARTPGIRRVRVAYLQPAEMRESLVRILTSTPGVAAYADLSFQHASASVLRRMRRFGDSERFLGLLADLRAGAPELGARTNVIAGFPGETRADVRVLTNFLVEARLDAVGVFAFSPEDGTEAAGLAGRPAPATVRRRVTALTDLVEELVAERARQRVGQTVEVLLESVRGRTGQGRAEHQAPEVDGSCSVRGLPVGSRVGDVVRGRVLRAGGVDLVVNAVELVRAGDEPVGGVRASAAAPPGGSDVLVS